MANILLVDSDEVAQKALGGIAKRGNHRFAAVNSVDEAWDFIRQHVKIDLLIVELELKEDGGLTLIERLRKDSFLEKLPVIVYTAHGDRNTVVKVLSLRAQNFLIKPYGDNTIFAEIAKATIDPWIQQHFEDEETICQARRIDPDRLREMLNVLASTLEKMPDCLGKLRSQGAEESILKALIKLSAHAKATGASTVGQCLDELTRLAQTRNWPDFEKNLAPLDFAARMIGLHVDPSKRVEGFLNQEELNREIEEKKRAHWSNAAAEKRCPMLGWGQLAREIDSLDSCPIVDSIAAAYKMAATGRPTSLSPLLDLVQNDPALTVQILISCNHLKNGGYSAVIEEPRMAVNMLGENRLAAIGERFLTIEEHRLSAPPNANWPNFLMFQLGTARLAQFTGRYLELPDLESVSYTAGLIHDLGKLVLLRLHPYAFQAIHDYALTLGIEMADAERFFLESTTLEMGTYFAEKQGLPRRFKNVLRWIDKPEEASEDAELVATVSLARRFCRQNQVGFNGDTSVDEPIPLEETPEWKVLSSRVYLNFNLENFERQANNECIQLKRELHDLMCV